MRPTVHSAVLPAITPDKATDFLGFALAELAADMSLRHLRAVQDRALSCSAKLSLAAREQRIELGFVGMVVEAVVQLGTRLHGVDDRFLRSVPAQRLVDVECCLVHRSEGGHRIERNRYPGAAQ